MPIANCARCGRIFNKVRRDICQECIAEEDKSFDTVRLYLKKHKNATLAQVAEDTGVDISVIVALIRDGRLILRDHPNLTYPCERCGKPTQAGRYCAKCTAELTSSLSAAAAELRSKSDTQRDNGQGYYSR